MMGQQAKQNELWVEPVNLGRRIPEDDPLRKLQQVLKLDFVREAVVGFYGRNGNVSVDPVIIMKMMLLLFWDNKLESTGEEEKKEGQDGPGGGSGGGTNDKFQSTTDPEATLVRHTAGKALPSYKNHRALDDLAGVITVTQTTTAIVDDGAQLPAVVAAHQETVGEGLRAVITDSKYGTAANFLLLAAQGIRSHMADLRGTQHNHRLKEIYPAERFVYDQASDTFRCPAGRKLYRHHFHHQRGYYEYRTRTGVCGRCRLAHLCTRSKAGRTLNRYPQQELLDRARRQSRGPSARRDRQRRQWMQERNFGEPATEHGFKRARWRGLVKQTIQDQIIAALQNLKILIRNLGQDIFRHLVHFSRLMAHLHTIFPPVIRLNCAALCIPSLMPKHPFWATARQELTP
jgi:Transposase DDE domain